MRINLNNPSVLVNATLSRTRSLIGTCQYPAHISNVVNHVAPTCCSVSSMRWIGYSSRFVTAFSLLKSRRKRKLLSFFLTSTTGKPHRPYDGSIIPFASMSRISVNMRASCSGDRRSRRSGVGGASPVSIECPTRCVAGKSNGFFCISPEYPV